MTEEHLKEIIANYDPGINGFQYMEKENLSLAMKEAVWDIQDACFRIFGLKPSTYGPQPQVHQKIFEFQNLALNHLRNASIKNITQKCYTYVGNWTAWVRFAHEMGFQVHPELLDKVGLLKLQRSKESYREKHYPCFKHEILGAARFCAAYIPELKHGQFLELHPIIKICSFYGEDLSLDSLKDWLKEAGIVFSGSGRPNKEKQERIKLLLSISTQEATDSSNNESTQD